MFDPEEYKSEFLRYHTMAATQQHFCNLGSVPHTDVGDDELMKHVELYDVVERKYAGFSQIVLDIYYADDADHPYIDKFHDVRRPIAHSFRGARQIWGPAEFFYVFLVHRLTGSGINYAKKPSGYNNTILPHLSNCWSVEELSTKAAEILNTDAKAYTSVGYQFPRFPKKNNYKRGGDRFIVEFLPDLVYDLVAYLEKGPKKKLRQVGDWMAQWNRDRGLTAYHFQYGAFIADIADFFPEYVDRASPYFWGSNAIECVSYMTGGKKKIAALDDVMEWAADVTGNVPYNLEDVACDFIRWVENYIKPGHDYEHLCFDTVWNSSSIIDHPYGRQRAMLHMGLVDTFNGMTNHPSDGKIIEAAGLEVHDYMDRAKMLA